MQKEQEKTIHNFAKEGNLEAIKALLTKDYSLMNQPDENGFSPTGWALIEGHEELAIYLIRHGANLKELVKLTDGTYMSKIWAFAIQCGREKTVNFLINVYPLSSIDEQCKALSLALITGQERIFERLLETYKSNLPSIVKHSMVEKIWLEDEKKWLELPLKQSELLLRAVYNGSNTAVTTLIKVHPAFSLKEQCYFLALAVVYDREDILRYLVEEWKDSECFWSDYTEEFPKPLIFDMIHMTEMDPKLEKRMMNVLIHQMLSIGEIGEDEILNSIKTGKRTLQFIQQYPRKIPILLENERIKNLIYETVSKKPTLLPKFISKLPLDVLAEYEAYWLDLLLIPLIPKLPKFNNQIFLFRFLLRFSNRFLHRLLGWCDRGRALCTILQDWLKYNEEKDPTRLLLIEFINTLPLDVLTKMNWLRLDLLVPKIYGPKFFNKIFFRISELSIFQETNIRAAIFINELDAMNTPQSNLTLGYIFLHGLFFQCLDKKKAIQYFEKVDITNMSSYLKAGYEMALIQLSEYVSIVKQEKTEPKEIVSKEDKDKLLKKARDCFKKIYKAGISFFEQKSDNSSKKLEQEVQDRMNEAKIMEEMIKDELDGKKLNMSKFII